MAPKKKATPTKAKSVSPPGRTQSPSIKVEKKSHSTSPPKAATRSSARILNLSPKAQATINNAMSGQFAVQDHGIEAVARISSSSPETASRGRSRCTSTLEADDATTPATIPSITPETITPEKRIIKVVVGRSKTPIPNVTKSSSTPTTPPRPITSIRFTKTPSPEAAKRCSASVSPSRPVATIRVINSPSEIAARSSSASVKTSSPEAAQSSSAPVSPPRRILRLRTTTPSPKGAETSSAPVSPPRKILRLRTTTPSPKGAETSSAPVSPPRPGSADSSSLSSISSNSPPNPFIRKGLRLRGKNGRASVVKSSSRIRATMPAVPKNTNPARKPLNGTKEHEDNFTTGKSGLSSRSTSTSSSPVKPKNQPNLFVTTAGFDKLHHFGHHQLHPSERSDPGYLGFEFYGQTNFGNSGTIQSPRGPPYSPSTSVAPAFSLGKEQDTMSKKPSTTGPSGYGPHLPYKSTGEMERGHGYTSTRIILPYIPLNLPRFAGYLEQPEFQTTRGTYGTGKPKIAPKIGAVVGERKSVREKTAPKRLADDELANESKRVKRSFGTGIDAYLASEFPDPDELMTSVERPIPEVAAAEPEIIVPRNLRKAPERRAAYILAKKIELGLNQPAQPVESQEMGANVNFLTDKYETTNLPPFSNFFAPKLEYHKIGQPGYAIPSHETSAEFNNAWKPFVDAQTAAEIKDPVYLLTYSIDMGVDNITAACPGAKLVALGRLDGYKWHINAAGRPSVTPSSLDTVYGLVYTVSLASLLQHSCSMAALGFQLEHNISVEVGGAVKNSWGLASARGLPVEKRTEKDVYAWVGTSAEVGKLDDKELITEMQRAILEAKLRGMPDQWVADVLRKDVPYPGQQNGAFYPEHRALRTVRKGTGVKGKGKGKGKAVPVKKAPSAEKEAPAPAVETVETVERPFVVAFC